jgi:hypothetical protein
MRRVLTPLRLVTLPRLDRGILYAVAAKDRRVKPGEGERVRLECAAFIRISYDWNLVLDSARSMC